MPNQKIVFLVVLYKKKCSESDTLRTLLPQIAEQHLVVWDNSPVFQAENKPFLSQYTSSFSYISCPENLPLSEVYEQNILQAGQEERNYLTLLDHDSCLADDFVTQLQITIQEHPDAVIVPRIFFNNKRISPAYQWKWFGWETDKIPPLRLLTAVNSGVTIPVKRMIKNAFLFPKGLKSYGTDTFLFLFCRKHAFDIVVSNSRIDHDLTFYKTNTNHEQYLKVYKEHMKAMYIIFSPNFVDRVFFLFYAFLHGIKTALVRKKVEYAYWWIKREI